MEADFSGYATKNGLKCSDGRVIGVDAFKGNDGQRVPLVWQHRHNDVTNVLGHAILENRSDGVYAYGFFNDTPEAKHAREMISHGDIKALSIYANNLVQKGANVIHGVIRELSLVLSGANPGAFIDNISIKHGDSYETVEDEAVIFTGEEFDHSNMDDTDKLEHAEEADSEKDSNMAENSEKTVKDVFDSMTEEQKNVVYFMIGEALEDASGDSDSDDSDSGDSAEHFDYDPSPLIHDAFEEGIQNMRNVFDQSQGNEKVSGTELSHAQVQAIVKDGQKIGSLKDSFLMHAQEYGFDPIDVLFPDARALANTPEMIQRQTEWVQKVIGGTKHSPFARIKGVLADITADEARARGYVKGNLKKEEVIKLLKRVTTPTTIYKKQKLDRDDIVDITDFDVVAWLKAEMRLMLNEEIARAILFGDGRSEMSEDKIDEDSIRPIAKDDPMYAHPVRFNEGATVEDQIDALIRARSVYRGSGQPTLYTTQPYLTDMLLTKDKMGRRVYSSLSDLADALMVKEIVPVEAMETEEDLVAIFVNLADYTIGADKGGEVSMFDDFDIDFNQHKYLIETRISGALTKPKSAIVVRPAGTTETRAQAPSFDGSTDTITFPEVAGVVYTIEGIPVEGKETITSSTDVVATAEPGYRLAEGSTTNWNFTPSGE